MLGPMSRLLLGPLLLLALTSTVACKENGNDYLQAGLTLLGEAERGDCQPEIQNGQTTIDAGKVAECLDKTKAALEQLHKARELGVDGKETADLIAKTEDEVKRLESMLRMVSRMQHDP
jgi:hypothetical protein